jgi:DNA-3-methyladenine glycosylase I
VSDVAAHHPGVVVFDTDGKPRCEWVSAAEPEMLRYHDTEWGTPTHDPVALFETLSLGVFQVGLGWMTVFHKRDAFRRAFHGFDPARVAKMTPKDVDRLLTDEHIIRNRAKIEATVHNAGLVLAADRSLDDLAWSNVPAKHSGGPLHWKDAPTNSAEAEALTGELKAEGYKFVGPTSVYAFMQTVGVVNDHVRGCFRALP